MKIDIKDKLEKIDKDHYSLLVNIGKIAHEEGQKAYLVGGMVRDLLLGFDNLDIDIVVENNAKLLADVLVKKIPDCELAAKHDRFHTSKVIFNIHGKKIPVDLASTRQEIYEHPAALPTVSVSDLKKDLYRRDFTINALAVSLLPDSFGEIVDLFNSLIDLKNKKIKVLHDLSFIDDPTRMIRAVRFAAKLSFKIEEHTQELLKKAIKSKDFDNLIEKIRGDRIKIEIRYLFNLPNIEQAIKAFFESGIYRMVSTELKPIRDVIPRINGITNQWLIYLAFIMKDLDTKTQEKIMKNLQLTNNEITVVTKAFAVYKELANNQQIDSMILYKELRELPLESIILVKSLFTQNKKVFSLIEEYIGKTSKIKLEITGQDLIKMGVKEGKELGEILEKVLEKKIENPSMKKEDEIKEIEKLI